MCALDGGFHVTAIDALKIDEKIEHKNFIEREQKKTNTHYSTVTAWINHESSVKNRANWSRIIFSISPTHCVFQHMQSLKIDTNGIDEIWLNE